MTPSAGSTPSGAEPLPISAVVLAGGAGRRVDGEDKGLLLWQGNLLIGHAINKLRGQVAEILISANRNLDLYGQYGCPVLTDSLSGFQGPLFGLEQGLIQARHGWVMSVPVDTPELPTKLPHILWAQHHRAPLIVARSPSGPQAVVCLCQKTLLPHLQHYLASGERKVQDWFQALPHVWADFDEAVFFNCNRVADLA